MPTTAPIALGLAVFFLLAALVNALHAASKRRKIASRRAAEAGGGTEEEPIHMSSPFAGGAGPAQAVATPAEAAAREDHESEYVWE